MQNEFIPKKGTSYPEIKPHLSDNFDKPVYYHLQFAPKNKRNYSSEQLNEATHPSKYLGLESFAHTELDRRAYVAIFETVLKVSFYYCPNYPHGCMYHLDWNDSHALAVYQKAQANLTELASLLFELGYTHANSIRSEKREPEKQEPEKQELAQPNTKKAQQTLF